MTQGCPQGEAACLFHTPQINGTLTAELQHLPGGVVLECDAGVANVAIRRTVREGVYEMLILCKGAHRVYRVRVR